jgi:hypothetical protein
MNSSNRQFEADKRNSDPNREDRIHGFTASTVVLSTEDEELYERRRKQFHEALNPVGFLETELVDEIAAARWRQQRCIVFETALIDRKIDEQAVWFNEKFEYLDVETRGALGFNGKTNLTKALRDASTFEQRHRRTYEKAMKELKAMQKERKPTGGWAPSPARDPQIALVRSRQLTPEPAENEDPGPVAD